MQIGTEINEAFRYKLRMMGVPITGPTNTFCDNESVVKNASKPESTLSKKHNSVAYHKVRESVAAEVIRVTYEPGSVNLSQSFYLSTSIKQVVNAYYGNMVLQGDNGFSLTEVLPLSSSS